jgi:hypothetical protein
MWAMYFHKLSTNKNPQHGLCPQDSWCKYNTTDRDKCPHYGLPEVIMLLAKQIYRVASICFLDFIHRHCVFFKTTTF